ncbi:Hypothetical protein GbCGDNIH9_0215 [Granulibacter bethesdensis]|uniref:Glycosyltransferase RgtA/B/C/D-like domain-containing protein n=1 Tax=Granulibacter bethesdensis TaxID=364410 RepID=A0AAC9KCF2_9PROT|nr:DUF6311 domain-containing protein [Granulibacter bethesdensis]APH53438.1 Hypothetical protein GbCGDNIH9_0215 [Granulibacter bethesdensis]APH61016.1 Hypothetical protein GbCGDNIH8_0215 [Granulibacter bethesdensis]
MAQHIVGQWYFLAEPWNWPPLVSHRMADTAVSLTDSIPLTILLAKLFQPWLPKGFETVTIWLTLCWMLQPVAAIYALRGLGEKRLLPALAIAVMAISMPTFIFRIGHAALCGHFLILLMVGLYFRLCAGPRLSLLLAGCVLTVLSLLIHPYLMVMVASLFLAVPVTLKLRGDKGWRKCAAAVVLTGALVVLTGSGASLWGAKSDGGYGHYSMNLLAPFYPASSALLPNRGIGAIDMTGGQYEGFQYLGAGLLLLLIVLAFSVSKRTEWHHFVHGGWRRHGGLLLACLCLILLAISHTWYLGPYRLLVIIPQPPGFLQQIRASGRLFWPVAYTLLPVSIAAIAAWKGIYRHTIGMALIILAAGLQFLDTSQLRAGVRTETHQQVASPFDSIKLREILAGQNRLNIYMPARCWNNDINDLMQVLWVAAQVPIAVNTMYTARTNNAAGCSLDAAGGATLATGEVKLFLPNHQASAFLVDHAAEQCRALGALGVCTADTARLEGLPAIRLPHAISGERLPASAGHMLSTLLVQGWLEPAGWGTWSVGPQADLLLPAIGNGALHLVVQAQGFAPVSGGTQHVTVLQNGVPVAEWDLTDMQIKTYQAELPPVTGLRRLTFRIARPISPTERQSWSFDGQIGFGLEAVTVSER